MMARGVDNAAELARLADVKDVTVRAAVNGTRGLSKANAERFARVLGVDAGWLLFGKGKGLAVVNDSNNKEIVDRVSSYDATPASDLIENWRQTRNIGIRNYLALVAKEVAESLTGYNGDVGKGMEAFRVVEALKGEAESLLESVDVNIVGASWADFLRRHWADSPRFRRDQPLNQPHNLDDNPEQLASNVRGQLLEASRDMDWHKREMVEVMGIGQGGDGDGFFEWNGEVIDHVKRPPKLAGRQRVFAIYLTGDSMYPAYRDGALIYVDANLKPRIGRDVLIELKPKSEGEAPKALVKRVVSIAADALKVEQFNPPMTFTIRKNDIRHAYLVLEMEELF